MENKKGLGIIGLIVICLTVSAIFGIAYATFSQNLTISGGATVSSSKWKVAWYSMSEIQGYGTINNIPEISASGNTTSIGGWSTTLAKPGEVFAFDVTVKNFGDFDAKLTDIRYNGSSILSALGNPSNSSNLVGDGKVVRCTGTNADTEQAALDAENVCGSLQFMILCNSNYVSTSNVSTLTAGSGTETYTIGMMYMVNASDDDGSSLPKAPVTIDIGQIDFIYTQQ